MSPSRIAYAALGSFACTVFLLERWQHPSYSVVLWIGCASACGMTGIMTVLRIRLCTYAFAMTTAVTLAFAVVGNAAHVTDVHDAEYYANTNAVTLTGFIVDEPDRRPMLTKYTVQADTVTLADGTLHTGIRGNVLITDRNRGSIFFYGDRITAYGVLKLPEPVEEFRYDRYLSRYGIYAILEARGMREAADVCKEPSMMKNIRRSLYAWKENIEHRINMLLPEPHASFMAGLLTGSRKGIPEELMNDFATTGLTHIIAISGYNITMITAIIMSMLFWLPVRWRFLPSVSAIITFTVFVGASAAVVRAAIMGILGLLAMQCERIRDMRLTLLWTLAIMITWNPRYLWYDAGFQLSFLSVIGLLELSPYLGKRMKAVPEFLGIRESLQATIAAQIATLPLSVLLFGRISLVAPLANVLIAPFIPLAMLLGTAAVILSPMAPPIGYAATAGSWMCLQWIILVARFSARIPYAAIPATLSWVMFLAMPIVILVIAVSFAARYGIKRRAPAIRTAKASSCQ